MKLLVFAGAGTSVELGVPAMTGLGEEFLAHSSRWDIEPALVRQLMGDTNDVEHLIEALDRLCSARDSLDVLGTPLAALERVDKIRAEVEWFVQHAAERVVASDAQHMWGSLLRAAADFQLTLVTTNYDRAIDLAAHAEKIPIEDGFAPFGNRETASWNGFSMDHTTPRLVKLHGSTDWYASGGAGDATKLRHPMPLFGRATLRLASGIELGSAMVLPSREKLLTHDPYPRLSQVFLNATDQCDLAIFVGTSMRDPHIRSAASTIARRAPILIVNLNGSNFGIDAAIAIRQPASDFLISTLPNALLSTDPIAALRSFSTSQRASESGILTLVRQATDDQSPANVRCQAIELLDEWGLCLHPDSLRRLLSDGDTTVARYAMGLILLSPRRADLIEYAASTSHAANSAFAEDLRLLRSM